VTRTNACRSDRELRAHRWARKFAPLSCIVSFVMVVGVCPGLVGASKAGVSLVASPAQSPGVGVAGNVARSLVQAVVSPPAVPLTPVPPAEAAPVNPAPRARKAVAVTRAVPSPLAAKGAATASDCDVAMAYLASHAAPGFAHYCREGTLRTTAGPVAAYTCVPGSSTWCPDGVAEIIIAQPRCAASYKNEASNSYWDFSEAGIVRPGAVQHGRTWDPFGVCPAS